MLFRILECASMNRGRASKYNVLLEKFEDVFESGAAFFDESAENWIVTFVSDKVKKEEEERRKKERRRRRVCVV